MRNSLILFGSLLIIMFVTGCGMSYYGYRITSNAAVSIPEDAARLTTNPSTMRIFVAYGKAGDGTTQFADFLRARMISSLTSKGFSFTENSATADFYIHFFWANDSYDSSYTVTSNRETASIYASDGSSATMYQPTTETVYRVTYKQSFDVKLYNRSNGVVWVGHSMNESYKGADAHDAYGKLVEEALKYFCANK